MGVSGIGVEKSVTTVGISPWSCLYWCIRVCIGSSVRSPAVRSHMFVQSGQDGCECCWSWCRLIRVWMAK